MEREILFRGKRADDGKWVEGMLSCDIHNRYWIHLDYEPEGYRVIKKLEVIPKTVGQYTGKEDKDDKKIFEGDVLKSHGEVTWNDEEFRWSCIDLVWNDRREWHDFDYLTSDFEIIGTIYDN